MAALGVPEALKCLEKQKSSKEGSRERRQEEMRTENQSEKSLAGGSGKSGKGKSELWNEGQLCSHIPSVLSEDGNGKRRFLIPPNPRGFGVVLARIRDKQCTTNST